MVRVHIDAKKFELYAENAFKRDLIGPLAKAAAKAIVDAPKDTGKMAGNIRSRTRKEGRNIVGSIGIFTAVVETRRRGERAARPTAAENLVGITLGRPPIDLPDGKMVFRPKRMRNLVGKGSYGRKVPRKYIVTNFVKGVAPNPFILNAMQRVAARYNAGLRKTL